MVARLMLCERKVHECDSGIGGGGVVRSEEDRGIILELGLPGGRKAGVLSQS